MKLNKLDYHCCFLLSNHDASLLMSIAWRRMGACDYGIYLTRNSVITDGSAVVLTLFKAMYNEKGQIVSFLVKDGWFSFDNSWDDEHLNRNNEGMDLSIEESDQNCLVELADAFCLDWLESYAESDALSLLKGLGFGKAPVQHSFGDFLNSGLPLEVKKTNLPDVLAEGEVTENGQIYCFLPFHTHVSKGGDYSVLVLEGKMRSFFDLL